MNKFTYYLLPATGSNIGTKEGTIKDLLLDIPYLLNMPKEYRRQGYGIIPPIEVINDILLKGVEDAGMSGGCKWEPFQITEEDFEELIAELTAEDESYFKWIKPPAWVESRDDWTAWKFELQSGAPAQEYKRLWRNLMEAQNNLDAAPKETNKEDRSKLVAIVRQADNEMTNFILKYNKN